MEVIEFLRPATEDPIKNLDEDVAGYLGCGLQYTYNSIVGPLSLNVHWSSYTHNVGLYLSLGFDF